MHGFVGDPSSRTRVWLFADSDHAGEHDSRSTSGCFLALIGPNTFYPLTAFSKKQTSTAMSSTEAEVIAANVALRAVGLPSCCLWEIIQSAGGGTENPTCTLTPSRTSDYWINNTVNGTIVRVHNKSCLFLRTATARLEPRPCPAPDTRFNSSAMATSISKFPEFAQMIQKAKPTLHGQARRISSCGGPARQISKSIEAKKIRDNLTDFEYVGDERIGSGSVTLFF